MAQPLHHCAICVGDVDDSLRFYTEGLGLQVLMDHHFEGDWPALFGAPSCELRSVFLGDPAVPDAGVVELVTFLGAPGVAGPGAGSGPAMGALGGAAVESSGVDHAPPASGFFLLSFFVDVEETLRRLDALGHRVVGRIDQPSPGGAVAMATVRDPDGVLIELIDRGSAVTASGV